jgi:hypothetical protein
MIDMDVTSMYPWYTRVGLMKNQQNREHLMRVLNKKYWPHHVEVKDDYDEKERWCYENFKSSEWRNVGHYFAFKRGEDATLFRLRWV